MHATANGCIPRYSPEVYVTHCRDSQELMTETSVSNNTQTTEYPAIGDEWPITAAHIIRCWGFCSPFVLVFRTLRDLLPLITHTCCHVHYLPMAPHNHLYLVPLSSSLSCNYCHECVFPRSSHSQSFYFISRISPECLGYQKVVDLCQVDHMGILETAGTRTCHSSHSSYHHMHLYMYMYSKILELMGYFTGFNSTWMSISSQFFLFIDRLNHLKHDYRYMSHIFNLRNETFNLFSYFILTVAWHLIVLYLVKNKIILHVEANKIAYVNIHLKYIILCSCCCMNNYFLQYKITIFFSTRLLFILLHIL